MQAIVHAPEAAHPGPTLAEPVEGWSVVDCAGCGFPHLAPLPSADALRATYRRHYYESVKPDYLARERAEQAYWALEHDDKLDAFAALRASGPGRLLDVGCSGGFFLAHAARRGWEVLGVEPSEQAAGHARALGVPVVERFLDELDWEALGTFDAVHLKLVLEHLPDPAGVLAAVRARLRPGGVVCVQVPNDFNQLQAAVRATLGTRPWWIAPPYHVNYFDFASLRRVCARAGLAVVSETTNFPMEVFLLMGEPYVGNDYVGRACHERRMALERRLADAGLNDLRRRLYAALATSGLGREAIVYAQATDATPSRDPGRPAPGGAEPADGGLGGIGGAEGAERPSTARAPQGENSRRPAPGGAEPADGGLGARGESRADGHSQPAEPASTGRAPQ